LGRIAVPMYTFLQHRDAMDDKVSSEIVVVEEEAIFRVICILLEVHPSVFHRIIPT
jgi:hypothetical protein